MEDDRFEVCGVDFEDTSEAPSARIDGVVLGRLAGRDAEGRPLVEHSHAATQTVSAASTVPVAEKDVGRRVALLFVEGDPERPLIVGFLHGEPAPQPSEAAEKSVEVDGERLTFSAKQEIVLRCGKASLTLTRAGKIILRGAYLSSRSSGVHRIQGASVHIN